LIFADIFRTSMTRKAMHTWFFPVLSLAVGLGHMLWFDYRFLPFMGLLMGPPDTNSFLAWGIPALFAGLFGFLRAKPKEIWSYGLLMWMPRAIRFGTDWMIHPGAWLRGFALVIVASSFLAAIVGILASYAGFALRKVATMIGGLPEEPPRILGQ
jgi:hypothetical protein